MASDLGPAVPEQRDQQSNADRQRAETEDEQGKTPEGHKGPDAGPRDDTKQGRRS